MHVKKKFTLLAAQEAEKSTKTFSAEWVEPQNNTFNSLISAIFFPQVLFIVVLLLLLLSDNIYNLLCID